MDVNQLKTLIHVAELGSLSKAAERLRIAQPALSRQVRLLEEELDVTLFDRHGRGMVITEMGRRVLDHAENVLREMDEIRHVAGARQQSFTGKVAIGVTPTIAEIVMVPLVKAIRDHHPLLNLRFSSAFSGHLLDWLQRAELDLVFSYDPPAIRTLRTVAVMTETLVLIERAESRGARSRITFTELADMDLVIPSSRHGLRVILDRCANQRGVRLNPKIEADSFGSMVELVRCGYGATVLPLASVFQQVSQGVFRARAITEPEPARNLALVLPSDRQLNPAAKMVGDMFLEIAKDQTKRGIWSGDITWTAQR